VGLRCNLRFVDWWFEVGFLPFAVYIVKDLIECTLFFVLLIPLIQKEGGSSILDRVMGDSLNWFLQDVPREEAKCQASLAFFHEVKIHSVDDLVRRNEEVYCPKVLWKTVSNEDAAEVNKHPELLIDDLQR